MSPRISCTEIEPPISNFDGPFSVVAPAVPPARTGTMFEPPNNFSSCANAGAEKPDAVITPSSVAAGCDTGGGSGAESSQLLRAGPSASIAACGSTVGASLRQSDIVAADCCTIFGPPALLAIAVARRGVCRPSFFIYSIGVQPPSDTLLKRKPYENAQTSLSSI